MFFPLYNYYLYSILIRYMEENDKEENAIQLLA